MRGVRHGGREDARARCGFLRWSTTKDAHGKRFYALGSMMHVVGFLLFGLLIGVLARMLVPGESTGGWPISMAVGVAGSMLGGFFGRVAGLYGEREPAGFVMSLLGAFVLVATYHAFAVRRRAAARTYR